MRSAIRVAAASALVVAASFILRADTTPPSLASEIQLQLGDLLFSEGKYLDSLDAYRNALKTAPPDSLRRPRIGVIASALRVAEFDLARIEAEKLFQADPKGPDSMTLYGDALWSSGLFQEAENEYRDALAASPELPRGHHGMAKALAARSRLDEAMAEAQEALKLAPREPEFHHTVGVIFEREHRYEEASAAFASYVNLLPNKDRSEKAQWTRAEIRFLDSFKGRTPFDFGSGEQTWTVPIRIDNDKVLVSVKVNGGSPQDFVLDTGAEQTVVSRDVARRRGILPITYIQTAGVGDVGLRGLQVGRIDSLEVGPMKVRNIPCLIKNPPLSDLPAREPESFSPIALGLSMRVDYARHELVMARSLPKATYATELPLRLYRLATVRGIVNGRPATFVVDTGGEVISISAATAGLVSTPGSFRRIPLKVYGTSGWDKDAFLLPNVDLEFESIRFSKIPVVVLNLKAPSALLGFQLGGIVGHKFLSKYRVSIDLAKSVVGLDTN